MRTITFLSALIIIHCAYSTAQSNPSTPFIAHDKMLADTAELPKDSTAFYFPLNSLSGASKNTGLDSFVNKWYSKQLFALQEPIIYLDRSQNEMYRFTWLRTFHNPAAIRIERHGENFVLFWKLSNGAGGYDPGKLIIDKQKALDKKTWEEFIRKLNQVDFWNLATNQDNTGYDGSEWILEGKTANRYHVVTRWTPKKDSKYYECCDFLLGLTDLKINGRVKY